MRMLKMAAVIGGITLALASASRGDAPYPDRLVRIVVPFTAGSIADGFARILADKLGEMWNQKVIVENRPGIPGSVSVATSAADGYTLMVTASGHVVAKLLNKDLPYDPLKNFVGVTKLASVPQVAAVTADLPVKTLADFIALAKEKPHKLNFASNGIGSIPFLCFEVLKYQAKIDLVPVPYKGAPESITGVMRGDAQVFLSPLPIAQQMAVAGKLKLIAINYATRNPQIPDVATIAETVPAFKCDAWLAVLAPAATPRPVVAKISADIGKVLGMPDVVTKFTAYGAVPSPGSPEAMDAQMKSDAELYGKVLRAAGVVAN